jgi:molybdopterin synthase sulfur carrier subunit
VTTVHLPADLAAELGAATVVRVGDAPDLGALVADLERLHPGLRRRLCEADGTLRPHLAVYLGGREAEVARGLMAPLAPGAEVWVLRAVSGG